MKCLRNIALILFILHSLITPVKGNNTASKDRADIAFEYIKKLGDAEKKFYQKCKKTPKIKCNICKKKILNSGEFFGGLIGRTLTILGDDKSDFEELKKILEESIKLLSEGSFAKVTNFMLHTANSINFLCTNCHGTSWEHPRKLPSNKSRKTA